jgi:hypothetical protein
MSDLNIYQRINAVMKEVTYVQKDKAVSGGGANYKAVTHDQVVSVIRSALVAHGIVIETSQESGEFIVMRDLNATPQPVKMGLYQGRYNVKLINIDKPDDKVSVFVDAHAQDNGDKAPGKCITYAVKTAMLKLFCLETGENDESRASNDDMDLSGWVAPIMSAGTIEELDGLFEQAQRAGLIKPLFQSFRARRKELGGQ